MDSPKFRGASRYGRFVGGIESDERTGLEYVLDIDIVFAVSRCFRGPNGGKRDVFES